MCVFCELGRLAYNNSVDLKILTNSLYSPKYYSTPVNLLSVVQVLLPLLQTLTYLHAEGIIHRDVKPEHVLFNSEKVAKLSGFFLAQVSHPCDRRA